MEIIFQCFCLFLIFIILTIVANLFSKKAKEFENHGESNESEDLKRRQAERRAQRMAKQRREHSPEPPTLAEIKAKLEEEKQRLTTEPPTLAEIKAKLEEEKQRLIELKRVQEDQAWVMQEELELERSEIEEPEVESAPDEDLVSTEQVIEPPESDPGVRLVEAVPLPEALTPMPPEVQDEVVEEPVRDVDDEAVEQSSPEEKPADDASVTVELFCETCMGEEVVNYDSEQIFKDQFEGQPVAWNGLLKSIDQLSYDRHFEAKNGFLATIEIFEIKGRYDTRPVLAVVLLTPEQKAAWEPSLNHEMSFSGTLFALDAFGKKVYLNLRD
jgi:flagellar biosynthesis GTPase FlhF